ncbi:MFS transporter [Streptomyces hiroshimensis]|uniref:MFS transporter n=1 Tax=Streptomyces hiroshimensis TaxID=66424 RepID=A0ABQ2YSK7_9ACTN|nr:MFS transporter [Streptomyces hiroshimensis]GGX91966.1 MFS transporter [Streptomyces hiroshimensis]
MSSATSPLRTVFQNNFGGLPRPFWIVFAGMIANRIGTMVVPFLVFYLGSRGISTAQTGGIVIALGIGGMFGPVLGGSLADRIGRRSAVIIGLVATPAGLGALLAAPSPVTLGAAAALLGLTSGIYRPAASALVGDVVGTELRGKAFSLLHWGFNIGTAVASAAAGYLAARGFWLLFLLDAVTCLAYAVIVIVGIPKDLPRPEAPAQAKGGVGYGVVFRDRLMLAHMGLSTLGITIYTQTEFTIPLAIRSDGLSPAVYGLVGVANAVLVVALQPVLYGRLAKLPRIKVLAASWALIGIGVASTGLAGNAWQYVLTVVVWSVGEVVNGVVAGAIVADIAPAEARGRYQGAISWVWSAARLAAPATAVGLFTTVGPAALWWGCAVTGILTALATLRLTAAVERRVNPPQTDNSKLTEKAL